LYESRRILPGFLFLEAEKMTLREDYACHPLVGRTSHGRDAVEKSISQANVINPFLVSTPSTAGKHVHPLFTDEFGKKTYSQLIKNRKQINRLALFYMFAIPVVLSMLGLRSAAIAFLVGLVSIYVCGAYELRHVYSDQQRLSEKVQFYTQTLYLPARVTFIMAGMFAVMGALQVASAYQFGGLEMALSKFGLIFQGAFSAQYYRFFTAQFMHAGFLHWALNLMAFIWFGLLCHRVTLKYTALLAVALSVGANVGVAALAQIVVLPYEGLIGFSGGIAGLAGILFGASVARHPDLPKDLYVSVFPLLVLTFFCFSLVTRASTLLHLVGMLLGVLVGVWLAVLVTAARNRN
jgi:rhomboid protease GluP